MSGCPPCKNLCGHRPFQACLQSGHALACEVILLHQTPRTNVLKRMATRYLVLSPLSDTPQTELPNYSLGEPTNQGSWMLHTRFSFGASWNPVVGTRVSLPNSPTSKNASQHSPNIPQPAGSSLLQQLEALLVSCVSGSIYIYIYISLSLFGALYPVKTKSRKIISLGPHKQALVSSVCH